MDKIKKAFILLKELTLCTGTITEYASSDTAILFLAFIENAVPGTVEDEEN